MKADISIDRDWDTR